MRFRASSAAAILTGATGITPEEKEELSGLMQKITLNKTEASRRDTLVKKRDSPDVLMPGGETYVEKLVNQEVYQYSPPEIDTYATSKGTNEEQDGIDLLNVFLFTNYVKSDIELTEGDYQGHPDIVDDENLEVLDIKLSYNKETFPKLPKDGENSTYIWQIKIYLYMLRKKTGLDWRKGKIVYILVNTPLDLIKPNEDLSMHIMDDLDMKLRFTFVDVYLSDEDIAFIERRGKAANEYAVKYRNILKQKNE